MNELKTLLFKLEDQIVQNWSIEVYIREVLLFNWLPY